MTPKNVPSVLDSFFLAKSIWRLTSSNTSSRGVSLTKLRACLNASVTLCLSQLLRRLIRLSSETKLAIFDCLKSHNDYMSHEDHLPMCSSNIFISASVVVYECKAIFRVSSVGITVAAMLVRTKIRPHCCAKSDMFGWKDC